LRARVQSAGRRALARRSARSLHLALGRVREELSRARRRAAIGAIAAGLAHEINNPAAFVVADLHELRDLADEVEDPGQAASLRTLADEALAGMDRIRDAIRDLSVFAAAAHRRSLGPPQPLDLATLLRQRCARLGLGERIELAIAGDARVLLPPGAEDELEALLGLLLREATAPSDGPSVQGRVRVGLRASGAEVALSLRPPADAATPTDDPSLALPLAIAAELAERLSGQIEARDGGFGLRLPAAPVVEPTSELADRAPVVGAPGARVERPGGV
jgi:signal transduction histidine kinase